MRVRLLVPRAAIGGPQQIGDEIDVAADEGSRMIDRGQAELVRRRRPERAVPGDTAERAVK